MISQKILAVKIKAKGVVEYLRRPQVRQYEHNATVIWAWFEEVEAGESITAKMHYELPNGETLTPEQLFVSFTTTEDLVNDIPNTEHYGEVVIPVGTKVYAYEIPQGMTTIDGDLKYNIVAYLASGDIIVSQQDKIRVWKSTAPTGTFVPDEIDATLEAALAAKTDLSDFNELRAGTLHFTYAQFQDLVNAGVFYRLYNSNGWWYAETPNGNTLTIGGEQHIEETKNTSGATILDGMPVMYIGAQGDFMQVAPASATGSPFNVKDYPQSFLGVATENIADNSFGRVSTFGQVRGLVLWGKGAENWVNGTVLYFDPTDNYYTSTRPTAPNPQIIVGIVYKRSSTSSAANGILFVRPSIGYRLRDLHDVQVNGEANGNILEYYATGGYWRGTGRLTAVEELANDLQTAVDDLNSDKANIVDAVMNEATNKVNSVEVYRDGNIQIGSESGLSLYGDSVSVNATSNVGINADVDISVNASGTLHLIGNEVYINFEVPETQSNKGAANGYAPLGADSKVPSAYIPNSFDDVLEFATYAALTAYATPTTSKLYVVIADETSGGNHSTYRYSGSIYVRVSDEMSASEIKVLYESNADTNAYSDVEKGKVATAHAHSQVANGTNPHATTFANIVGKPTTIAGFGITDAYDKDYIDNLTDYNGWQQTLLTLTPLANTDTISRLDLVSKDRVMFVCKNTNTGEIDTDELVGDLIVDGTKFVFFDNANVNFTVTNTVCTFNDSVGDYELYIYAFEVAPQEAVNIGYDNSTSGLVATEVQSAIDELDDRLDTAEDDIDTLESDVEDLKSQDVLIEKRLDSVEELTRKQSSDVASASDTEIISLGKDVAETPLRVQLDGLLLDAPQLVTNGDFSNGTTGWNTILSATAFSVTNDIATFTGTIQNSAIRSSEVNFLPNNKYYYGARIDNQNRANIRVVISDNVNWTYFFNFNAFSGFQYASAIQTLPATIANGNRRLDIRDNNTSGYIPVYIDYAYVFNLTTLITNKTYAPDYDTTFDLMTDANIKTQMDYWVANGTLPNSIQAVDMQKRIKSVPKNLFDKSRAIDGYYINPSGDLIASSTVGTTDYIKVKPSTNYVKTNTGGSTICYFDINKTFVSYVSSSTSFTTPSNAFYVRFSYNLVSEDTTQLELGSTATTYTPYRSSELYLNGNSKGYKLPNGVMDTIEMRNGKYYKVQRVAKYTLQASDIPQVTSSTFQLVRFYKPTNSRYYNIAGTSSVTTSSFYIKGYIMNGVIEADSVVEYDADEMAICFPLGTYANLAAAQTALAGTVIYYQLATPIETEISAIGNAMAYPNGTVYVEQATSDYGIYGTNLTISNSNYPILAFDEIYKLNADGSSTKLANSGATISGDKLSFTHTSITSGDSVWFSYYYYSSTPNIMGRTTVYFYDDKLIVTDSVTSTVYRLVPTVASGVLTWTIVAI